MLMAAAPGQTPPIRRLLVRAPNWLGDVILSLPALRDLRRSFPEARVEVLARAWVADLSRAARVPAGVRGRSQVYYYRAMLAGVGLDTTEAADASLRCPEEWSSRGA